MEGRDKRVIIWLDIKDGDYHNGEDDGNYLLACSHQTQIRGLPDPLVIMWFLYFPVRLLRQYIDIFNVLYLLCIVVVSQ